MKRLQLTLLLSLVVFFTQAQNGISEILAGGVEAANLFSNSYMTPAAEAYSYNLSTGWYDDARVIKKWKFKIQIKGQSTFSPDDKKSFILDPQEYEAIIQESYDNSNNPPANIEVSFGDGSSVPRDIATALGANNPDQQLIIRSREAASGILLQEDVIDLPQGIGSEGLDYLPAGFLQLGLGLGSGLELKGRLIPEIEVGDAKTSLYGVGLQWELTELLQGENPSFDVFAFSLLAGYTHFNAAYDFEDGALVKGSNQSIETQVSSLNLSAIVSTNFKTINFYGGVNYNKGTTQTDLLGTYTFSTNTVLFPASSTIEDPVSVETDVSGVLGTVGAKLTLGAFNINADYTFGEFSTATASVFFRI